MIVQFFLFSGEFQDDKKTVILYNNTFEYCSSPYEGGAIKLLNM